MISDSKVLLKHVDNHRNLLDHNRIIFEILEGDLLDKIKDNMKKILISDRAYEGATKMIPPINILKQVNSKISTIYTEPPTRTADLDSDQFLIDYYEETAELNSCFSEANKFFNAQKSSALEPFLDGATPSVRVISGHQFLPYSSNIENPLRMTEFIKFMGKNQDGKEIYFVYSKDEFKAIDENGDLVPEFMVSSGGINPYGVIPQIYVRASRNLLIPLRDTDTVQMCVLLPSMWASINYGINFQAHSLIYGIDLDFTNIDFNPDSFLVFKSDGDKKPSIGTIKPEIDIAAVDKHILDLFNAWLESKNIRPGEGIGGSQNSLSGVALSIKEMGTGQNRKDQIRFFKEAESDFWYKLKHVHNYWVSAGLIRGFPSFSEQFSPSIEFAKIDIAEDEAQSIEKEVKKLNNKLTTRRRAIQKLNPHMDEDEINILMEEIDAETTTPTVVEDTTIEKNKDE